MRFGFVFVLIMGLLAVPAQAAAPITPAQAAQIADAFKNQFPVPYVARQIRDVRPRPASPESVFEASYNIWPRSDLGCSFSVLVSRSTGRILPQVRFTDIGIQGATSRNWSCWDSSCQHGGGGCNAALGTGSRGRGDMRSSIITPDEAERIGFAYALRFRNTLQADPSLLRAEATFVASRPPYYGVYVESPAVNNMWWCNFYVHVDAQTGRVKPESSRREWSCEFLSDPGGGT
jgi:hypothetical protein